MLFLNYLSPRIQIILTDLINNLNHLASHWFLIIHVQSIFLLSFHPSFFLPCFLSGVLLCVTWMCLSSNQTLPFNILRPLSLVVACLRACSTCSRRFDSNSKASCSFLLDFFSFFRRFCMVAKMWKAKQLTKHWSMKESCQFWWIINYWYREIYKCISRNTISFLWFLFSLAQPSSAES